MSSAECVLLEEEPLRETAPLLQDARRTDAGNAQRLAFLHGEHLRWSPEMGWLEYDGQRWQSTDDNRIAGYARDVAKSILEEAAASDDSSLRSTLAGWALECEKASSIRAMVYLLKSEPGIRVSSDELDSDVWLLNTPTGTLDLRTQEISPHDAGDLLTKLSGASFNPDATCPRWEKFMLEIMDGDREMVGYLRRFAGYCLTGDVKEQCFLFCSGVGANGKSVFVELLASVLGDYASPLSPSALVAKQGDSSTNELAALRGCRFAYCTEIDSAKTLDSGLLKAITGGDSFRVRYLYREFFTLRPELKLCYNSNGTPKVRDTSYGFWRRCKHVPFNVSFPPDRRDDRLREKLLQEKDGILNWALSGLREWMSDGLKEPVIVSAATREYQDDQSVVRSFLEERTQRVRGCSLSLAMLHEDFLVWSKRNAEKPLSNKALGKEIESLGYVKIPGRKGKLIQDIAFSNMLED
jgi:putative DNA primase/helicase